MVIFLRELCYYILKTIEKCEKELHHKNWAVNYAEEKVVFEMRLLTGVYYGTYFFSDSKDYLCLDITLPVVVKSSYRLAVEHFIASVLPNWETGTLQIRDNGAVVLHYAIDIFQIKEKADRLWLLIHATSMSKEEQVLLFKLTLPCLLPDKLLIGNVLEDAVFKIDCVINDLIDVANGLPQDDGHMYRHYYRLEREPSTSFEDRFLKDEDDSDDTIPFNGENTEDDEDENYAPFDIRELFDEDNNADN